MLGTDHMAASIIVRPFLTLPHLPCIFSIVVGCFVYPEKQQDVKPIFITGTIIVMLAAIAVHLKLRSIYYDMIRSYQARQEQKKRGEMRVDLWWGLLDFLGNTFRKMLGCCFPVHPTRKCGLMSLSVVVVAFFSIFLFNCCWQA